MKSRSKFVEPPKGTEAPIRPGDEPLYRDAAERDAQYGADWEAELRDIEASGETIDGWRTGSTSSAD